MLTSIKVQRLKKQEKSKPMANFTEEEKVAAWNNAYSPPSGYDGRLYRLDSCGALIYWPSYGKSTDMGWEVDHVYPEDKGGKNDLVNLRAMQHANNSSKNNSYPWYSCSVTYNGINGNTAIGATARTVHKFIRNKLVLLYGKKAS